MQESDTYLMILDEGEEKGLREAVLLFGEQRYGPPEEPIKTQLASITDLERLRRMVRRAANATSWQEIVNTA